MKKSPVKKILFWGNFKSHSKNGFRCHSQRAAKGSLHLLPGLSRRSFMRRGKGNRRLSRRSVMRRRKNAPFIRSKKRALWQFWGVLKLPHPDNIAQEQPYIKQLHPFQRIFFVKKNQKKGLSQSAQSTRRRTNFVWQVWQVRQVRQCAAPRTQAQ